ncbi:hypothetical protein PoB_005344700 [Plakobranchus ocellatus]|uniref:Uncharacterized protein n=1 Tax=Plakobranchus ocellatus TaxID=259542 RepID=A0AAV4C6Q4_9GAST|nr:hypothetical protein PoB_005344700 [Plakobranchus ocellatus]
MMEKTNVLPVPEELPGETQLTSRTDYGRVSDSTHSHSNSLSQRDKLNCGHLKFSINSLLGLCSDTSESQTSNRCGGVVLQTCGSQSSFASQPHDSSCHTLATDITTCCNDVPSHCPDVTSPNQIHNMATAMEVSTFPADVMYDGREEGDLESRDERKAKRNRTTFSTKQLQLGMFRSRESKSGEETKSNYLAQSRGQ